MEIPFKFNQVVGSQWLVGRKDDINSIAQDYIEMRDTLVFGKRLYGKSSLVRAAAELAMDWDLDMRVCKIDLFNVNSEADFYVNLVQSIIRNVSKDWDDAVRILKEIFPESQPRVSVKTEEVDKILISFDADFLSSNASVFWEIPYKISAITGLRLVVVVDDFHRVEKWEESQRFFERITANWLDPEKSRSHSSNSQDDNSGVDEKTVTFCLCGSSSSDLPGWMSLFSQYLKVYQIDKVCSDYFISFISSVFSGSGKYIDSDLCEYIYELACGHPSYVQQLSQMVWLRTGVVCTKEIIDDSLETCVAMQGATFVTLTESLTSQQICYLNALVNGEKAISSADVLYRYRITSATSASRSKSALLQMGLITLNEGVYELQDPFYAVWLKNFYFA